MYHNIIRILGAVASGAVFALAAVASEPDAWRITAVNPDASDYYGVTVANGQIGIVSSPEPLKTGKIVLGGVYDVIGRGRINQFMPAPKMLDVDMKLGGRTVNRRNIKDFTQTLNMKDARFECSFTMPGRADVKYSYTALRNLPYNCILSATVVPLEDIRMDVSNVLSTEPVWRDPVENFNTVANGPDKYSIASTTVKSPVAGIEVGVSSVIIPDSSYCAPSIYHKLDNYGVHSQSFSVELTKGKPYTFHLIGTLLSDVTAKNIVGNEITRQAFFTAVEGPERLLKKHRKAWDDLWQTDIVIDGDPQSQQDIRSMLYHLYSFIRPDSGESVSPMGLSGDGYGGHVFWDTETWMFPVALVLKPELARAMLQYRYDRLPGARQKAYTHGYRGAMFPWESAASGNEEIQAKNMYGNFEVHISADIALAAWQYWLATRDLDWLRSIGLPLLSETAEFWTSRVDENADGSYSLINVIGADERNVNKRGGKNVNNNAYTIGIVKENLHNATLAAKVLGFKPDPKWAKIEKGLNFKRDSNGIILEHDTYAGENTKQADVVLLAYPLGFITDKEDIRRNLEYYIKTVPRKTTPSMSKGIYSILYSRLGDTDKAWAYFRDSYLPNLNPPFRVIAEFDGGTNPYFITGAGNTLQAVLMGFCGLSIGPDGITSGGAALPDAWQSITLKNFGPQSKTMTFHNTKYKNPKQK